MAINARDLDNWITGVYGEDQFRGAYEPIGDDICPPETTDVCLNGNDCDQPYCPEHGDDTALTDAENEGFAIQDKEL